MQNLMSSFCLGDHARASPSEKEQLEFSMSKSAAAPQASAANFVKKSLLIFNATYLELNGFNASMWGSLEFHQSQKSYNALINVFEMYVYV